MTTYYQIVGWDNNYEVDNEGQDWVPGKPFWQEPLEYVRFKATKDIYTPAEMALLDLAGPGGIWVQGAFIGLVETVADRPRPLREGGVVRNDRGEPATVEEIALMLRVEVATVQKGLRLLVHPDVALLQEVVTPTEVHG